VTKRIIAVLVSCLGLLAFAVQPVQAVSQTTVAPTSVQKAEWSVTGWKLGGRPASSTLCVANGIASDYPYEALIENINNPNYGPSITVLNRCDAYSITNRMTIASYVDSSTVCAKFTNTHRTYDSVQGKSIWDQNVVLWYNNSTYCIGDGTGPVRAHRVGMFMEYVLGLSYDNTVVNAVICSASSCYYNVPYVTSEDQRRLGYVYGQRV
jgi:hypothetical protein